MYKKIFPLLFLAVFSFSCKDTKNDSAEPHLQNENVEESQLPITKKEVKGFKTNEENETYFELELALRNETGHEIKTFRLMTGLEMTYPGGEYHYYSGAPNTLEESEEWEAGTEKTFSIVINPNISAEGIAEESFQRTPAELTFNYDYSAMGDEGGYKYSDSFDVLEAWKEYQKELGVEE